MIVSSSTSENQSLNRELYSRNKSITLSTAIYLVKANYRRERWSKFIASSEDPEQKLKDYFNFSYKTSISAFKDREKELSFRYAGSFVNKTSKLRLLMAQRFASELHGSLEEAPQIRTLLKHRQLLHELTNLIHNQPIEQSVLLIQARIDALCDPESPHVVFVSQKDEEYTSFSFPGGCLGASPTDSHTILFECRRNKQNDYFFVIHNRGKGNSIKAIHGPISVISATNKRYRKASVPIPTSKAKLLDRQFLTSLLCQFYVADTVCDVYDFLVGYFAGTNPKVPSVITLQEQVVLEKRQHIDTITKTISALQSTEKKNPSTREKLRQLGEEKIKTRNECHSLELTLIASDNNYHSLQNFGTCSDSCLIGPEKPMASRSFQRKLKLYSIEALAHDLEGITLSSTEAEKDKALFLQHSKVRALQIQTKLTTTRRH